MENELRIIRYLYDEDDNPEEVEQLLAEDEALRTEYQSMQAVKEHLDRRTPPHADAEVLTRITQAAARATEKSSDEAETKPDAPSRADRDPVARPSHRRRRIGVATAALVAVLAVGVAVWQLPAGSGSGDAGLAGQESATGPSMAISSDRTVRAQDVPAWDEGDDVARLHQYIQTVQARSGTQQWDAGELPLRPASQ